MANDKSAQPTSGAGAKNKVNGKRERLQDAPVIPLSPSPTPSSTSSATSPAPPALSVPTPQHTKSHSSSKHRKSGSNKSHIGGTAITGAKSTQPRPAPANPQQQQQESYNREMRRRMERLGTGPQSETDRAEKIQKQRNKRIERRQQRVEERREEARKRLPASRPGLGRRNTIFLIAVVAALVILFIVFALLRFYFHVLG